MHISIPVCKNVYYNIITQVFFTLTGYMYRSGKIILRESDRRHIKYDEKSENNVIKNMCEMMI